LFEYCVKMARLYLENYLYIYNSDKMCVYMVGYLWL